MENRSIALAEFFKRNRILHPDLHAVLGSGFSSALKSLPASWTSVDEIQFASVQGLVPPTVEGHSGKYQLLRHTSGLNVLFQVGRLHGYEGHEPAQVVSPVLFSRKCGTKKFLLTNAAGSLHADWSVGSAMVISDHVNLTGKNPLLGSNPKWPDGKDRGPRFPDLTDAYSKSLRASLHEQLVKEKLEVHEGTYLGLLGPSFETPAEVKLFVKWGLDAVGMSTVWETIALAHAGAEVAGISLMSNLGCGLTEEKIDHHEILKACEGSAQKIVNAILNWSVSQ